MKENIIYKSQILTIKTLTVDLGGKNYVCHVPFPLFDKNFPTFQLKFIYFGSVRFLGDFKANLDRDI
jgi:hypothetical protein